MASEQIRFLQPQLAPTSRLKNWGGCWSGLSCFGKHKRGGKRIVPASRMPEGNAVSNQPNGPQAVGLPNQTTGISAASLYAPPSSPASFSNSALPSTAQSPSCFLSANSPISPSSTMFVTGPYAHEPQLVSPPVFSTYTTEPSTAPVTPPPELAHLTTPSSPDVPYARFLLSSADMKCTDKSSYSAANDLHATYSLYPISRAPEKEFPLQWDPSVPAEEPVFSKLRQDSNFFCPETFAQFYQDQSSVSHSGGRLSISRESDAYSNGGNGHQNRQTKVCKPDPEELEAYRASFGFSADEIITTAQYVEISNVSDVSLSTTPMAPGSSAGVESVSNTPTERGIETGDRHAEGSHSGVHGSCDNLEDQFPQKQVSGRTLARTHIPSDDEEIYSKLGAPRTGRKYQYGSSNSDAEIKFRRGRSLREERSRRQS